jgi:hypothetical protein
VLFVFDDETGTWAFEVEEPPIVGGGDSSLEAAGNHADDALAFALSQHD